MESGDGVGHCIVQLLAFCSLELIHTSVSSGLTKKRVFHIGNSICECSVEEQLIFIVGIVGRSK
jgi:hypothetical protein